jgi:hypothetical protein
VSTSEQPPNRRDTAGPWLVVFLIAAVAVLITWVLLSLFAGGADDEAQLDPAVSAERVERPAPPSASPKTRPAAPPAAPPDTTPAPPETDLEDRYPLGQRQGHDLDNDDRRADYGEIGPHCFVGEECGEVPPGAEAINQAAAGSAGIDLGGIFGGAGSTGSPSVSGAGVSIPGAGGAATRARRNASRVPQGQIGSHCFAGESCPPIPEPSGERAGSRSRTLSGPVVPCGEPGVHSRVGQSRPCVNGVISRVGTRAEGLPPGTTIGLEGGCYMVVEQTTTSATVVAIPCPAATENVSQG